MLVVVSMTTSGCVFARFDVKSPGFPSGVGRDDCCEP